jgi:hypothetical protein
MRLLTNDRGERAIECDLLEEALPLTAKEVITVQDNNGVKWYMIGEATKQKDAWIVPLQVVDQPHGLPTIRDFVMREDGALS